MLHLEVVAEGESDGEHETAHHGQHCDRDVIGNHPAPVQSNCQGSQQKNIRQVPNGFDRIVEFDVHGLSKTSQIQLSI